MTFASEPTASEPTVAATITTGFLRLDPATGAPLTAHHREHPDVRYLLDADRDAWHTAEHAWGTGFVITDRGSARWAMPETLEWHADGNRATHRLLNGLTLRIERRWQDAFTETYILVNDGESTVTIRSVGIVTPFRDVYDGASEALVGSVHAHVWTGGASSWVLAQPMSGDRPVLSLIVREGALSAYSIESRNQFTSSNVRGHIVLHPTDAGRNPDGFGGQRPLVLAPGASHTVSWSLQWHDDIADAAAAVARPWWPDRVSTSTGESITLPGAAARAIHPNADVRIEGDDLVVTSDRHGVVDVDLDGESLALLFHAPVRDLVLARVAFILRNQISSQRPGVDAHAFVSYDTETGLTQLTSAWPDWSDGAERIAMPTLLQQARMRGWVGDEVDAPLHGWARFARARLLDGTAAPRRGSGTTEEEPRLYDSAWLAHFFADQFRIFGDVADLDLAARILERSYELGAVTHLSIGQPEAVVLVADLWQPRDPARAEALRRHLSDAAEHFLAAGADLPAHEVVYEQSMVAPLVSLFALAGRQAADPNRYREALVTATRWLRAFGGPQPHARLRSIGIRHWDGFWFGKRRQWGDVFPHYWSVLTAVALRQLPDDLRDASMRAEEEAIFRANLANFEADGTATAAFLFPSTVDGVAAHVADPLANDQDWALTLLLRAGALDADPSQTGPREAPRMGG